MTITPDLMPLLGAALGDALGAGVEGTRALVRAIAEDAEGVGRRFWPYSPFGFRPGELTDDTQMALTAVVALRRGRPDVTSEAGREEYTNLVGGAYRAWHRSHPPDMGMATSASLAIDSVAGGLQVWAAGAAADPAGAPAGNGSLMRATATFTAGYRGQALLIAAALDSAITHHDPRCIAACVWYVATLEAARRADDSVLAPAMRQGLTALAGADVFTWLAGSAPAASQGWDAFRVRWPEGLAEVARVVEQALAGAHIDCLAEPPSAWPTGFVSSSLGQAAWAALQGHDAQTPIRLAVLHGGGDADTIGAIAGGLAGARFGARALDHWPAELLERLTLGHPVPDLPALRLLDALAAW